MRKNPSRTQKKKRKSVWRLVMNRERKLKHLQLYAKYVVRIMCDQFEKKNSLS